MEMGKPQWMIGVRRDTGAQVHARITTRVLAYLMRPGGETQTVLFEFVLPADGAKQLGEELVRMAEQDEPPSGHHMPGMN